MVNNTTLQTLVVSILVIMFGVSGVIGKASPTSEQPTEVQDINRQISIFTHSDFGTKNAEVREEIIVSEGGPDGNLWFGPYTELPAGEYRATFLVNVENSSTPVLNLDVTADNGTDELASETVAKTDGWEWVTLNFTLEQSRFYIEFRGHRVGSGTIEFQEVWAIQKR